jgi:hypothetical protein
MESAHATAGNAKGVKTGEYISADRFADALGSAGGGEHGTRAVFVLTKRGARDPETPVFGVDNEQGAAVFTDRENAILYVQTAGWLDDYEPYALTPGALGRWVQDARGGGLHRLLVDPNRHSQERGEPQPLLDLDRQVDLSGEGLYRELQARGGPVGGLRR